LAYTALAAPSPAERRFVAITDAELEVDADGDGVPDGWRLVDTTMSFDREHVAAGDSSICVETTGRLCLTKRVWVKPYGRHTLSAQYRVERLTGGHATIRTYYFNAAHKRIGRHTQGLKRDAEDWQRATLTTRAPCLAVCAEVYAICAYKDSKLYIDDVSFREADDQPRTSFAFRLGQPLTIDGDLGEWRAPAKGRPVLIGGSAVSDEPDVLGYESFISNVPALSDMSAVVHAAWDEQTLYLAATVQDDQLSEGGEGLTFAFQATRNDDFDLMFKAAVDMGQIKLEAVRPSDADLSGFRSALRRHDSGYTLELALPFAVLKVEPEAGKRIGFDVALRDIDPRPGQARPREAVQIWREPGQVVPTVSAASCGVLELRGRAADARLLETPAKWLAALAPDKITGLKKLCIDTPLARNGAPQAVIVTPPSAPYPELGRRMQARIQALSGATLPLKADTEIDPLAPGSHVLAIGNAMNNRVILHLHTNHYSEVTEGVPGPKRFRIKSIHDPYGAGHNVILVGASGSQEAANAVDAFMALLPKAKDLVLGRLFVTEQGDMIGKADHDQAKIDQMRQAAAEAIQDSVAKMGGRGLTSRVGSHGLAYSRTGDDVHAWCFRDAAYALLEYVRKCRNVYTDRDSFMDSTFWRMAIGWDLVEESPVFMDADRRALTNLVWSMAKRCSTMCERYPTYPYGVIHNHMSFPLLSSFFGARYFEKYYDSSEAARWLEVVDLTFGQQARSAQPQEDAGGYSWLVPMHLMQYALARPALKFFHNGNARGIAELLFACTDNNGGMAQFGDAGGPTGKFRPAIPAMAAWFYTDPGLAWLLDTHERGRDRYQTRVAPRLPAHMVGVKALAMTKPVYDYSCAFYSPDALLEHRRVPFVDTFHKISFRSSLEPGGQFLLLDGWGRGCHFHEDANTIIRFKQHGKLWLLDCHYTNRSPLYHNGVTVVRDGEGGLTPIFARLRERADLGAFVMTRTSLDDYNQTDWHRNVLWRKGEFFVVLDELCAKQDGEYSFQCLWRTMGDARVEGADFVAEQDGDRFLVKNASPVDRLRITCDVFGIDFETGQGPVKKLHQVANAKLAAGERYVYANLLYAAAEGSRTRFDIRALSDRIVLVRSHDPERLSFMGRGGEPVQQDGLRVTARAFCVEPDLFALSQGTALSAGAAIFKSEAPVSVELSLRTGQGIVEAEAPTEVALLAARGPVTVDGEAIEARFHDKAAGQMTFAVDAGRHVVGVAPSPHAPAIGRSIQSLLEARWQRPPAVATKDTATDAVRTLTKVWSYSFPAEVVGQEVSGRKGVRLTSSIPPMKESPWVQGYRIKLDHLLEPGSSFVCWEPDESPVITMDLGEPCDVDRVVVRTRWTYCAAKAYQFHLGRLELSGSNDGFQKETLTLGTIVERQERRGKEDVAYRLDNVAKQLRYLRVKAVPRPGAGVFLYEIEVHRTRRADELTDRQPAGIKVHQFAIKDIDGDGRNEVVVGAANRTLSVLAYDGQLRWQHTLAGSVNAVTAADLDGDGTVEIVAGASDERLHAFDHEGNQKWDCKNRYFFRPGHVLCLKAADLDRDGKQEVVLGTFNSMAHCIDHTGRERWECQVIHHWTKCLDLADLDRDGQLEAVFGSSYVHVNAVSAHGKRRWLYRGGGKFYGSIVAADVTGDDNLEVIAGSKNCMVHCCDHEGQRLWRYNTGGNVNAVAAADLTGDTKKEVVAGSGSFWVYALTGKGELIWTRNIGDAVNALALGDLDRDGTPEIVAGADDSCVHVLNARGEPCAVYETGGYINAVGVADVTGDGDPEVLAASWDGNLYVLRRP